LLHGLGLIPSELGFGLLILIVFGLAYGKGSPFQKRVVWFFAFPYSVIWVFLFSYDIRNISIALPPVAYLAGNGIFRLISKIHWKPHFSISRRIWAPAGVLLLVCLASMSLMPTSMAYKLQESQLRTIGNSELNGKLYEYFEHSESIENALIFTDYQYVGYLPKLSSAYQAINPTNPREQIVSEMSKVKPTTNVYILVHDVDASRLNFLNTTGFKTIFENCNFVLLKMDRR
jgi:hypothetical protein